MTGQLDVTDLAAGVRMRVAQHVARITIDNPRRANSLTRPMLGELRDCLDAVDQNPQVRVIVLAGAGKSFCAGLDIAGIAAGDPHSIEHEYVGVEEALGRCAKPTIAAIRGHCIGGGTQLAIACDLRVAADTARFAITPAKLGLIYPPDSIDRLTRVIGPAATKRLLFTADPITADAALAYGLVTDVVPEPDLDGLVDRLAATIARRSPVTIAAAKEMTNEAAARGEVSAPLRRRWRDEPNADLPAGLAAFAAKTAPVFPSPTH